MARAASVVVCALLLAGCGGGGGGGGVAREGTNARSIITGVEDWWRNLRARSPGSMRAGAALLDVPAVQASEQFRARLVQGAVKNAVCAGAAALARNLIGQQSEADRVAWRSLARGELQALYALYPAELVDRLADGIGDWLYGQADPVGAGNVCAVLKRSGL